MQVRLYGMFGQRLPSGFSLGEEVSRDGVERAELYGSGLVVLTSRYSPQALDAVCPVTVTVYALNTGGRQNCGTYSHHGSARRQACTS